MSDEFPDAVTVRIGKAVESELNAIELPENPIIERSYAEWDLQLNGAWQIEPSDRPQLDIVVHTTEVEIAHVAQGVLGFHVPVDVAIRKRFGKETQITSTGRIDVREIDALLKLHQAAFLSLFKIRLREYDNAAWKETNPIVAPWKDHLRELRQFTSIVRTTFTANLSRP